MSLETQGIKLFWRDILGFCRDIPEAPEKFEKKMFGFNSRPLKRGLIKGSVCKRKRAHANACTCRQTQISGSLKRDPKRRQTSANASKSEDAMGWVEKGGGWKTSRMTPLPKRGFGPPLLRYVFHPPQVSVPCFSCTKIHDRADQKLFWRGPKIFGRARSLVRFAPPIRFAPPHITAQANADKRKQTQNQRITAAFMHPPFYGSPRVDPQLPPRKSRLEQGSGTDMTGRPGVPDDGNDWRKFRAVPRSYPLRSLVLYFV